MTKGRLKSYNNLVVLHADMAELADAPDLGSGIFDVQVQVLLSAYCRNNRLKGSSYHVQATYPGEKHRVCTLS